MPGRSDHAQYTLLSLSRPLSLSLSLFFGSLCPCPRHCLLGCGLLRAMRLQRARSMAASADGTRGLLVALGR
eukprot:1730222-Pyramimonas_sp.AAC.1